MFTKSGKNVKSVVAFFMAVVLLLTLCACGETEEAPKATATVQVSVEPTGQTTPTPTGSSTEAPTEVRTEEATGSVTATPAATGEQTTEVVSPTLAPTTSATISPATASATVKPTSSVLPTSTTEPTSGLLPTSTTEPTSGLLPTSTIKPTATVTENPLPTSGVPGESVDVPTISTKYVVRREFADYVSEIFASDNLDDAKLHADMNAHKGYSVYDASGNTIYCKYSQNVTNLFKACKKVSDIIIVDGFKIGAAPKNPAIDNSAKLIAGDSFIGWVLYECGYSDGQIAEKSLSLSGSGSDGNLAEFCVAKGFTKITNFDDIKAGDIVFYSNIEGGATVPNCVCIVASDMFEDDSHYLYDISNVEELNEMQPMRLPLPDFMFAYRIK